MGSAEAFRGALLVVRAGAVLGVVALWRRLVVVAELRPTVSAFAVLASLLTTTAQRRAVALADLHLAAALGAPPVGLDPAPFFGPSTSAPLAAVLASSSAFVLGALAVGEGEEVALDRGLYRATRVVSTETVRAGTDALAAAAAGRTAGWTRLAGPRPCSTCAGLADGSVRPWADKVSAHPHCSCVQEVVR